MRLELLEQDRRQFIKIMDKLKAFPNELKEELENFAIDSQEQMKRVAPNLTGITPGGNPSKSDGTLRRSVGFKQGAKFVEVFASAPYAGYVEHGTRFQRPQPFFYPAIQTNLRRTMQRLGERFKNILK